MSFGLAPTKTVFPGWGRVLWGEVPGASFLILLCSVPRGGKKIKDIKLLNSKTRIVGFPLSKKGEISLGNFPGKFSELSRNSTLEISRNFSGWKFPNATFCLFFYK